MPFRAWEPGMVERLARRVVVLCVVGPPLLPEFAPGFLFVPDLMGTQLAPSLSASTTIP